MHQDPQNNEELILFQAIEKELSTDQQLQQIIKQIGQQNQNPRLLIFLQELFKALFNPYIQKDSLPKTIKILNTILNKQKFKNKPIQNSDLSHYINQKYYEVLAHFYEKAFLKGPDEASKHMNFVYYKKIVRDYIHSSNCQNQQMAKNILNKIDQTYQTFTGNTPQEFEMAVFESLNPQEQELLTQIVTDDQTKAPKTTDSIQERFILNLPPDMQEKFKNLNFTNIYDFKDYLVQEKQNKGIEKLLGYIFVDKLNFYLNSYYFVNSAKKIQGNKAELKNQLQELQKDIMDSQKDFYSFVDISYVKYFYKSLKSRRVRNSQGQCFSFKKKLSDLIKLEINSFQYSRKFNTQSEKWNDIYNSLYNEFQKSTEKKEAEIILQMIYKVQQLILSFLRYRWNYLYLFCALIVETKLQEDNLDRIINLAYEMMQNTNKDDLNKTFEQILAQLNEAGNVQIVSDYFDKTGHNLGYQSLQVLEFLLPLITNKLIKVMADLNLQTLKVKSIIEIKNFEANLIHDCSQNLKNYQKIFDKLTDSILEGEKEEKDIKASFLKTYPIFYQQKLKYLCNERSNKQQGQQFFKNFQFNLLKLKQDYSKKLLGQYQDIFFREDKINQICELYLQKEEERYNPINSNPNDNFKEILNTYIKTFFSNSPFVMFLPSILKGLIFFKSQKLPYYERLERIRFAAIAFKDRDRNEQNKFIDSIIQQKDLFTFEQQFQIAKDIYNFYITLPQFGGEPSTCKPVYDSFPIFNSAKSIEEYNTTYYNAICIFTTKFFSQDQKFVLKNEDSLRLNDILKRISNFMSDKTQFEQNQQDILQIQFFELKHYKELLIKEAQKNGDQNYLNKCIESFRKYATKQYIISDIMEYKKSVKIAFNEMELLLYSRNYWTQVGQSEIKNNLENTNVKKKIEEYFKVLINQQSSQLFNEKLSKDMNAFQDSYIKDLIKKQYPKYKEELDKYSCKITQQPNQVKQSILQTNQIQKKFSQIRQEQKFREFQVEDSQVLAFISEQFSLYMKQLLGKVFQVALTQKPGYEFKAFQNKSFSQNDAQMMKYKQNQELQIKYGPQKNSYLDISLLTSNENKNQLYYELCDYTPCQRQIDFRNFLIEIEPLQEDKLKNKIRKNKWKEEHPELEEVLRKRIKRGAELWNQVQDFLCKRETNDNEMESDEESEKIKGQQQQQIDSMEDDQLDQKIQDVQKSVEQQLLKGKSYINTRLNNMENDNPLLTQKEITVKTVQFVLEQHPYFKKSKILYKSYIL